MATVAGTSQNQMAFNWYDNHRIGDFPARKVDCQRLPRNQPLYQQLGRQVTCNRLGFQFPNGGPLATRGDGDMMHGFTGNQWEL